MTELEQQLTTVLTVLSKQYEAEMAQQAEQVGTLQNQVQRLEEAVQDLKPQLERSEVLAEDEAASRALKGGLQRDHRSVERGLNHILQMQQQRQRGPDRDYGPSH